MRIALVGAEFEENLAIRYIWGALEAAGHEVVQVVFNDVLGLEDAAAQLARSNTDLAGFSMVFTYRAREFADLATRVRELGYAGHMTAGGHFAAFNADALLRDVPALDSVVIGEGELILCDLAARLDGLAAVRGLVWRDPDGEIVRNAPAAKPPDLDELPHPKRKQPFDAYLGLPIVNMLSSRGCTHGCAFCSIAAWHRLCGGARYRMRSPERVADEMAELHAQGVRIFNFHDDNFLPRGRAAAFERVRALKAELDRRRLGRIAIAIKARPDSVDEELFALLRSMGLFRVFLGIEAGTDEALRHLGRTQTVADNERALAIVNRLDLHCCYNLLLFNPWSTLDDVAASIDFLRRHPHNPMNFCRAEVYAGTPLEATLRREGRLLGDYWGFDYRIADPQAEMLFGIVYSAFRARNYGSKCLHHRVMRVDYECQLAAHFGALGRTMRREAQAYTAKVNLNTCCHLEGLAGGIQRGAPAPTREASLSRITHHIEADNWSLGALGTDLLRRVAAAAVGPRAETRRGWLRDAVAAGFAAAWTISGAACDGDRTIDPDTHPYETIADNARIGGDPSLVRAKAAKEILPRVAANLGAPVPLEIVFHVDKRGSVERCAVYPQSHNYPPIPNPDLSGVSFDDPQTHDQDYSVAFSAEEVKAAMATRTNVAPSDR